MRKELFGGVVLALMLLTILLWWGKVRACDEVEHLCHERFVLSDIAVHYAALKKRWSSLKKPERTVSRLHAVAPFETTKKPGGIRLKFSDLSPAQLDRVMQIVDRNGVRIRTLDIRRKEQGKIALTMEMAR